MLSNDIIRRLGLVKYVVWHGHEALDKPGPLSPALALLAYQDAVEMLLRLAAEHAGAPLKQHTSFPDLIAAVKQATGKDVQQAAFLHRLNNARVNFKHFGNAPDRADVEGFRRDTESCAREMSRDFLSADFETVSLADLVRPRRVRNHIKRAEEHLAKSNLVETIDASAIAFDLLLLQFRFEDSVLRDVGFRYRRGELDRVQDQDLRRVFERYAMMLEEHGRVFGILLRGIDGQQYRRFVELAPKVGTEQYRSPRVWRQGPAPRYHHADAEFCIRFVVDSALRLEEGEHRTAHLSMRGRSPVAARRFRVLRTTPILVWPPLEMCERPAEEIRLAEAGEVLEGLAASWDTVGFTGVRQDGGPAFVGTDAIEPMPEP